MLPFNYTAVLSTIICVFNCNHKHMYRWMLMKVLYKWKRTSLNVMEVQNWRQIAVAIASILLVASGARIMPFCSHNYIFLAMGSYTMTTLFLIPFLLASGIQGVCIWVSNLTCISLTSLSISTVATKSLQLSQASLQLQQQSIYVVNLFWITFATFCTVFIPLLPYQTVVLAMLKSCRSFGI